MLMSRSLRLDEGEEKQFRARQVARVRQGRVQSDRWVTLVLLSRYSPGPRESVDEPHSSRSIL